MDNKAYIADGDEYKIEAISWQKFGEDIDSKNLNGFEPIDVDCLPQPRSVLSPMSSMNKLCDTGGDRGNVVDNGKTSKLSLNFTQTFHRCQPPQTINIRRNIMRAQSYLNYGGVTKQNFVNLNHENVVNSSPNALDDHADECSYAVGGRDNHHANGRVIIDSDEADTGRLSRLDRAFKKIKPSSCANSLGRLLVTLFPILTWLPKYSIKDDLICDIIAGVTIFALNVPQGLSYGKLAGADPINGIYLSLAPPMVYALMGTSRHISIGKT